MQSNLNIKERRTIGMFGMFLLGAIIPAVGITITNFFLPEWNLSHHLLHSAMAAFDSFAALSLATLLLFMRKHDMTLSSHIWLACGLLAMGILDGLHAMVTPDGPGVWLRCVATLAGGFLFALVWLPDRFARSRSADLMPVVTAVAVLLFGLFSLAFPELLPAMRSPEGYTPLAMILSTLGGLLFFASSPRFINRYLAFGGFDLFLFASLSLLFGITGISFGITKLWFAGYWFWHLLSNAVKYTEKGTVSIAVNLVESGWIEISVEDTGIGIREEDRPRIFEPFVRLDANRLPGVHGTGLGLYLTRKLVMETLKGYVTFTSEYGSGSRFVLHLPILNPERS